MVLPVDFPLPCCHKTPGPAILEEYSTATATPPQPKSLSIIAAADEKMIWSPCFVLAALVAFTLAAPPTDRDTLVLLDNLAIKETHSIFFKGLQGMCGVKCLCACENVQCFFCWCSAVCVLCVTCPPPIDMIFISHSQSAATNSPTNWPTTPISCSPNTASTCTRTSSSSRRPSRSSAAI